MAINSVAFYGGLRSTLWRKVVPPQLGWVMCTFQREGAADRGGTTVSNDDKDALHSGKPAWRTPTMTEDAIPDATNATSQSPGDDGVDQFGGHYVTYGIAS